ncbi:MAG: OmpA family protein, partial [Lachnospiraceae bacterium]|nr:OmpA family protein [Lachnospiraceae bacterium]
GVTQLPGIESILEYVGDSSEVNGDHEKLQSSGAEGDDHTKQDGQREMSEQELKEELEQKGLEQSQEMYDEISQMIESYSIDDTVSMDYNSQYVTLDLNGALLFDAGSAEIKSDAKIFMQKIASIMSRYKDCVIEIEGHTDNIPIHTSQYESNRYLSTARATKVYEYVMEQVNLVDANMKIAGYGESRPVASNKTEEGRAKNRRVSIKIYNLLNSNTQKEE